MSTPPVPELTSLQTVINNLDELPYCTGTVPLDATTSSLFYQTNDQSTAERLDFTKVTDQQLDNLARACDRATFGLAQQDVLDESYRKAGKMDANRFATHFSPTDLGILEAVSDLLLRGRVPEKSVRIELYKLNIYGPGGFFKAHVDTPRSDTMFGSLVVVLPTVHEGGSLIIRHNGKEWTFDSSKAVNSEPTPHAAFVAFFSDVEHEVMKVTSGFRVTLTYNLYLKKKTTTNLAVGSALGLTEQEIKDSLGGLLKNPAFLPQGGLLGFGFSHKYPFSQTSTKISNLGTCLKGSDAAIQRACDALSIPTAVKAVYRGDHESDTKTAVLLDHFADFGGHELHSSISDHLKQYDNGLVVYDFEYGRGDEDNSERPIVWVKTLEKTNPFSSPYVHYGNEASLSCVYGEICLVATVPPAGERK